MKYYHSCQVSSIKLHPTYSLYSTMQGFDPLGIVKSKEQLFLLREAEIKHARIAMLAAIGWPVSELCHYTIAKIFGKPFVHS